MILSELKKKKNLVGGEFRELFCRTQNHPDLQNPKPLWFCWQVVPYLWHIVSFRLDGLGTAGVELFYFLVLQCL